MEKRKKYALEFKTNAVSLSMERSDISVLARELGINKDLLYSWRNEYRIKGVESFPGKENTMVTSEGKSEILIKKKLQRLQQENEILKKALGIISREDL